MKDSRVKLQQNYQSRIVDLPTSRPVSRVVCAGSSPTNNPTEISLETIRSKNGTIIKSCGCTDDNSAVVRRVQFSNHDVLAGGRWEARIIPGATTDVQEAMLSHPLQTLRAL